MSDSDSDDDSDDSEDSSMNGSSSLQTVPREQTIKNIYTETQQSSASSKMVSSKIQSSRKP